MIFSLHDGRVYIATGKSGFGFGATGDEAASFFFHMFQCSEKGIFGMLVYQWAYKLGCIQGIADGEFFIGFHQTVFHFLVAAGMYDEAAGAGATLTAGSDSAEYGTADGHVEVGIFCNDDGIISAQFQQGFTEAGSNRYGYSFAHPGGTSGRNQGNTRTGRHGLTNGGIADDEGENTFR